MWRKVFIVGSWVYILSETNNGHRLRLVQVQAVGSSYKKNPLYASTPFRAVYVFILFYSLARSPSARGLADSLRHLCWHPNALGPYFMHIWHNYLSYCCLSITYLIQWSSQLKEPLDAQAVA